MYNQDFKNQFLNWKGTGISMYTTLFAKSESYEQQIGKDISEMNTDEFRACLKSFRCQFSARFVDLFRACQRYGEWSRAQGMPPAEWVGTLDYHEEYLIAADFPPLLLWEDIYAELLTYYPITEGYLIWPLSVLAWLGLNPEECLELRNEDVDLAHKQIRIRGRVISITDQSQWKVLHLYANTQYGARVQNRTFVVQLIDCGYFLKDTKTHSSKKADKPLVDQQLRSTFASYASKCIEANAIPKFTFSDIERMGEYHYLYLMEQSGELSKLRSLDVQRIFHVQRNTPTGKMLLTEYQLYKQKLQERQPSSGYAQSTL